MEQGELIEEAVRRIVRRFEPERIFLIGSAARGERREHSDFDFRVVVRDDMPRQRRLSGEIHVDLYGMACRST